MSSPEMDDRVRTYLVDRLRHQPPWKEKPLDQTELVRTRTTINSVYCSLVHTWKTGSKELTGLVGNGGQQASDTLMQGLRISSIITAFDKAVRKEGKISIAIIPKTTSPDENPYRVTLAKVKHASGSENGIVVKIDFPQDFCNLPDPIQYKAIVDVMIDGYMCNRELDMLLPKRIPLYHPTSGDFVSSVDTKPPETPGFPAS